MNGSIYLRLNVDKMLSAHKNMLEICNLKALLNGEFENRDKRFGCCKERSGNGNSQR